ncbi:MAG: hydrolase, partial [Lachnospiraceae bacterium]
MKKRIIAIVMVLIMGLFNFGTAFASTKTEAENKKKDAASNLDSVKSQIGDIESQQSKLKQKMEGLNSQLVELLITVDMLSEEKDNKEKDLKVVKKNLKAAKKNEKKQYEAMKLRIQYMYENGDNAFIEAILGSKDFGDLLNQVEYYDQIYNYDRDLLVKYQTAKIETEELKVKLTEEINDLTDLKEQYAREQKSLETLVAKLDSKISNFGSQLAQAKELASQYKATIVAQNGIIKEQERKEKARAEQERKEREEREKQEQQDKDNNTGDDSGGDSG